jgi:predicted nucleotidyltransferase
MIPLTTFGETIKQRREALGLPLRAVAAHMKVDTSLVSKWERGERKPVQTDLPKLAKLLEVDSRALLVAWLRDAIMDRVGDEPLALEALHAAEASIAYRITGHPDRAALVRRLRQGLANFPKVRKAWLFGSFARGDDKPGSDIDVAIEVEEPFSYFELADVQHHLEELAKRKVDVGFLDSFRPHVLSAITPDLQLIHAR